MSDRELILKNLQTVLDTEQGRCRFINAILAAGLSDGAAKLAALKVIPYAAYLKTDHWRTVARAAKERAGNRCQLCNQPGRLETHHRTYARRGEELPEDLIVLCNKCHGKFHTELRPDDGTSVAVLNEDQELQCLQRTVEQKRAQLGINPDGTAKRLPPPSKILTPNGT